MMRAMPLSQPSLSVDVAHPETLRDPRCGAARRRLGLGALVLSAALFSGCASFGPSGVRPDGLSLTDIVAMLDAKQPQADIARTIKQRGLVAQAKPDDVQMLEQKGAKSEVIDAVLIASWDDSNDVRYARSYYPYPYYNDPFWSPWPWGFGMSYGWGGGFYRPGFYGGYGGPGFYGRPGGYWGGPIGGGMGPSPTPPPIRQGGPMRAPMPRQ